MPDDHHIRAALAHLSEARRGLIRAGAGLMADAGTLAQRLLPEESGFRGDASLRITVDRACAELTAVVQQSIADIDMTIVREAQALRRRVHDGPEPEVAATGSRGSAAGPATTPHVEQVAREVCADVLTGLPGYRWTVSFFTQGGDDLDLRVYLDDPHAVDQQDVVTRFERELRRRGVDTELDMWFASPDEFDHGFEDPAEFLAVESVLRDGFDPHQLQVALRDTSVLSMYAFATMRVLHVRPDVEPRDPAAFVDRLVLTRDGAVSWMHWFTGCFLHDYLGFKREEISAERYRARLAKFVSRVAAGSTLAQLDRSQRAHLKPALVAAIRAADAEHSIDELVSAALMRDADAGALLDPKTRELLRIAGRIRSGDTASIPDDFVDGAEAALFYAAFNQGTDLRQQPGERPDPLTSYALGALAATRGHTEVVARGSRLTVQGELGTRLHYLPIKARDGSDNPGVTAIVTDYDGTVVASERRSSGGVVGGDEALLGAFYRATVVAENDLESLTLDAREVHSLLSDPDLHAQLKLPVPVLPEARLLDVFLRYYSRATSLALRESTSYTEVADPGFTRAVVSPTPLAAFDLGDGFRDVLSLFAQPGSDGSGAPVVVERVAADRPLFDQSRPAGRFYVMVRGNARIILDGASGGVDRGAGEFFGESSILGLPPSGAAVLAGGSEVLAVDPRWFLRFTQSRQPIRGARVPPPLQGILPVHLLYHMAARNHDKLRAHVAGHLYSPGVLLSRMRVLGQAP